MRIILVPLFLLCSIIPSIAQIGGLGGTKVGAYTAFTFGQYHVEFEPTFNLSRTRIDDLVSTESSVCWRMTYTMSEQLELGFSAPSDFSMASMSMKYNFLAKDQFAMAAMAGLNAPFGNRTFDRNQRSADDLTTFGIGLVSSWNIGDHDGIDASIQYQDYFSPIGNETPGSLFFNVDYGHYVANNKVMLILAAQYATSNFGGPVIDVISLLPGLSLEMKDNLAIVINTQHDLFSNNADPSFGFSMSVTTMW